VKAIGSFLERADAGEATADGSCGPRQNRHSAAGDRQLHSTVLAGPVVKERSARKERLSQLYISISFMT